MNVNDPSVTAADPQQGEAATQSEDMTMNSVRALQLAKDSYSGSTNYYDANIRKRIENDIRRFQSRFPSDSKYMSEAYRTRSRIFRPKTRATIRKNEAVAAEAFFSTLDVVNIAPSDDTNTLQVASAAVMKQLLQHRLTKSVPWFLICQGAYQDAQVTGVVISHQYWRYNEKKKIDQPFVDLVPTENFRFHPAAKWYDPVGTSPYLIQLVPMLVKDVRARMRNGRWNTYSDAEIASAAKNYDSTRMEREGNKIDPVEGVTSVSEYTTVWVHRNIIEWDDEDYIFYTLGTELLLTDPAPLESEYAHGNRPYVVGQCVIETHKNYPSGSSGLGASIQDEINEVTNLRLDNIKFVLNKRYFVKRNKQVDIRSLTRNVPSSVTLMTDTEDVKVLDTSDVTSSSYNEHDRLNLDYDDVAGVFSGSSVAANRKLNETVGGMNILTTNSNQVSAYQLKTFVETWVEPVLRQLVLLEQHYETDLTILELCANKAKLFQHFGIDALTDEILAQELTLNVSIGMGATNPTDKVNTLALGMGTIKTILAEGVLEKYGLKADELIKEVLGALGYRDGGRFFDFDSPEDPRIAALEKQIEQLQQALAAKHPPELIAAQVEKIREEAKRIGNLRVKEGVEASYSAMQAAEVVATMPAVAPIADQVLQMNGYQPPNPAGVDPNIQPPSNPMAGMEAGMVQMPRNTHPLLPAAPASPTEGVQHGIETQRNDGVIPQ